MSPTERSIALCIDGSVHSHRALEYYAQYLAKPGDRLQLLSVVEPPDYDTGTGFSGGHSAQKYEQAWQRRVHEADEMQRKVRDDWLKRLLPEAEAAGDAVAFHRRVSANAGETLCAMAQEANADLLVMGCRGLGKLRRTFLGSVSDYVLHHGHVPTVVVPPASSK